MIKQPPRKSPLQIPGGITWELALSILGALLVPFIISLALRSGRTAQFTVLNWLVILVLCAFVVLIAGNIRRIRANRSATFVAQVLHQNKHVLSQIEVDAAHPGSRPVHGGRDDGSE